MLLQVQELLHLLSREWDRTRMNVILVSLYLASFYRGKMDGRKTTEQNRKYSAQNSERASELRTEGHGPG